jgi:TolA-binding protein
MRHHPLRALVILVFVIAAALSSGGPLESQANRPASTETIIKSILPSGQGDADAEKSQTVTTDPGKQEAVEPSGEPSADRKKAQAKTAPGQDEVLFKTGVQMYNAELFEAAKKSFLELKSKYPESSYSQNASIWAGRTSLRMRNYQEALSEFSAVKAESGEYPASLFYLGETYSRMGRKEDSISSYYTLAARFPSYELADDALIRMTELYIDDRKGNLALASATRVIRDYPDQNTIDDAYFLIGVIYERDPVLKDMQISRSFYRKFVEKASAGEIHFKNSPLLRRARQNLRRLESTYFRYER